MVARARARIISIYVLLHIPDFVRSILATFSMWSTNLRDLTSAWYLVKVLDHSNALASVLGIFIHVVYKLQRKVY